MTVFTSQSMRTPVKSSQTLKLTWLQNYKEPQIGAVLTHLSLCGDTHNENVSDLFTAIKLVPDPE